MKSKTKEKTIENQTDAINAINQCINKMLEESPSTADKFCYWLKDYASFLNYEKQFSPKSLKRYKRGEIIKAHLGFNIGSEEGGLHYCVVLDKENNLSSPVVTVAPLTSLKENRDKMRMRKGEVFIGNDFRVKLEEKCNRMLERINELTAKALDENKTVGAMQEIIDIAVQRMDVQKELQRLKTGSIALVGQITTISKMRIYDPKTKYDVLANIRLSDNVLDKLDKEFIELFVQNK